MAIEIKEYVGHQFTSVNGSKNCLNLTEGYAETYMAEDSIMVDIEAIHSRITRNNTYYSPKCLKESVPYWTNPYKVPVIMHHNEKDGQIIGRVHSAEYTEVNTRGNTPALIFTANVGDEEGKKGIKNGTLSTVSIGVIAHDLRCSICNTNLAEEGLCEHEKGEYYEVDGQQELCYWIIEKMEPKEVSYVIVPSDAYAHNLKVYDAVKKKKSEVKESVEYNNPFAELIEATKVKSKVEETQEGKQIDEEVNKNTEVNPTEKEQETNEENAQKESEQKTAESEEATAESKEDEKKAENAEGTQEAEKSEEKEEGTEETSEDDKELEKAKEKIAALEKELETVKEEKAKLENKLEKVTETKESVERELVKFRAEKKKQLVETITELRSQLSLPEEDEKSLMESSEESLQLTIKSLNEFTKIQKNTFKLQTLNSPVAVSESKDNTAVETNKKITNVKESKEKSNKSLEDEIISLMESLF